MSRTTSGNIRTYRPVSATLTINFDSNLTNDNLRSPNWWKDRIGKATGVKNVKIQMDRRNVRITRSNSTN